MAEAIFAKYSKSGGGMSGIPSELVITNSTKSALGLGNNATLDDCLRIVALSDPGYSTVQVTLKDVDGSVLPYHSIRMQDPTGFNMVYTTDSAGQCIFKTQNGQMTFSDWSNNQYFDVAPANTTAVDCPVGMVRSISMQRYKSKTNGASINITSTQDINFSKYAATVDAEVKGADGRGGGPGFSTYLTIFYYYNLSYQGSNYYIRDDNTAGPDIFVYTNRYNGWINNIRVNYANIKANNKWYNSGGSAGRGSISRNCNINIQNKNVKAIVGLINPTTNLAVTNASIYFLVGQNNATDNYGIFKGESCRRYTNRGATGGSSSFLDTIGNGGAGGNNACVRNYGTWEAMVQGNNGGDGLGEYGYGCPDSIYATINIKTTSYNVNNASLTASVNFPNLSTASLITAKNGYIQLTNFRYK